MSEASDWIEKYSNGIIEVLNKNHPGILNLTEIYEGSTITKIANSACSGGIVEIVDISRTKISFIGRGAFGDCKNLAKIYFPNSNIQLDDNSFLRAGLLELFIPELMIELSGYPFNQCPNLQYLTVDENNKNLISENNCIFSKNFDKLIKIGVFVTDIPNFEMIQTVGNFAFTSTRFFSKFEATKNLSVIESYGFHAAFGLQILNLSLSTATIIETGTLSGLSAIRSIYLPHNTKIIRNLSISGNIIRALALPDSVTTIEKGTFYSCPNLQIISYFGGSDLSMSGIIVSSSCPRIKEIRVTFKYPSSLFSNYPVVFTALDYGILLIYKCPTFPICLHDYRYLITAVIIML